MTKRDAAEKVAKLERLARGTTSQHEAATARAQAAKLVSEHHLTTSDLETGEMGAAFDDLVDMVGRVVVSGPAMPQGLFDTRSVIDQVLRAIKDIGETDKAARLRQITTLVRTASFIAGDHPVISQIKTALDTAIKNHQLVL